VKNGLSKILALFVLILFLGLSVGVSQSPHMNADRIQLAENSRVVVLAVMEDMSPVVNGDKPITKTRTRANGEVYVELQKPADFILGRMAKFRIRQILKSSGNLKEDGTLNVFIPGAFPTDNQPILLKGETYLLMLNALKPTKEMSRAFSQPSDQPAKRLPFNHRSSYVIVDDSRGALRVTSATQKEVDRIRASLQRN
jgi:hypothetical protein